MKRLTAALLMSIITTGARAGTGDMQVFFTAHADIDRLVTTVIGHCEAIAPATVPRIQQQYESWRALHGPYQEPLQKIVKDFLKGWPDLYRAATSKEGQAQLENEYFRKDLINRAYCEHSIIKILSPGGPMLVEFKRYVENRGVGRIRFDEKL